MQPEKGTVVVKKKKPAATRQRRAHAKSRLGCGNCKLRRVKCDEARPACERCTKSGFICDYNSNASTLQLDHGSEVKLDLVVTPHSAVGMDPILSVCISIPLADMATGRLGLGELTEMDIDLATLERFRTRTAYSISGAAVNRQIGNPTVKLVPASPWLLHISLALTLIHDQHLASPPLTPRQTAAMMMHMRQGIAFFSRKLAAPPETLTPADRDALYASCILLGTASYAYVDTSDPRKAWPMREANGEPLNWLRLSTGKRAVLGVAQLERPDSVFHPLYGAFMDSLVKEPTGPTSVSWGALPPFFYAVFGISDLVPQDGNPYYVAVSLLARTLELDITEDNVHMLLLFVGHSDDRYTALLEKRDPRALLILAYWYTKMAGSPRWWHRTRAVVEGLAICMYLEERCGDDEAIMSLVDKPRDMFRRVRAQKDKGPMV